MAIPAWYGMVWYAWLYIHTSVFCDEVRTTVHYLVSCLVSINIPRKPAGAHSLVACASHAVAQSSPNLPKI